MGLCDAEDTAWPWDGGGAPPSSASFDRDARDRLARACARVFRDQDGAVVLEHLRGLTTDRVLGPEASDAALRTLEGQRALIAHLTRLIAEGRGGR